MSQSPDFGAEGSRCEFVRFWAEQGEEPAFLRRATDVEGAWRALLASCSQRRVEMLRWARMRLAEVVRVAGGDWRRVAPLLVDAGQAEALAALYEAWKPLLPVFIGGGADAAQPTVRSSGPWATVGKSLAAYVETVERFNAAWAKFLADVDLDEVNRLRADFNLYYPIEKAAAFDTQDVERLGFEPMAPATVADLRAEFPLLVVPEVASVRHGSA